MKNKGLIITFVLFAVILAAAVVVYPKLSKGATPTEQPPSVSDTEAASAVKAPDFRMIDSDEKDVRFSDFKGKPIVINFWATWCEPCKIELPDFNKAYKKYGDRVEFLMVNLVDGGDSVDGVKAFLKENGFSFPLYFDAVGEAAMSYGIRSIPQTVFVDGQGNITYSQIGIMSNEQLIGNINKLLGDNK